jgi:hypothetical protein
VSLWGEDTPWEFRYLATGHKWVLWRWPQGKRGDEERMMEVDGKREKARNKVCQ